MANLAQRAPRPRKKHYCWTKSLSAQVACAACSDRLNLVRRSTLNGSVDPLVSSSHCRYSSCSCSPDSRRRGTGTGRFRYPDSQRPVTRRSEYAEQPNPPGRNDLNRKTLSAIAQTDRDEFSMNVVRSFRCRKRRRLRSSPSTSTTRRPGRTRSWIRRAMSHGKVRSTGRRRPCHLRWARYQWPVARPQPIYQRGGPGHASNGGRGCSRCPRHADHPRGDEGGKEITGGRRVGTPKICDSTCSPFTKTRAPENKRRL